MNSRYKIKYIENGQVKNTNIEKQNFDSLPQNVIEIKELKEFHFSIKKFFHKSLEQTVIIELFSQISLMLESNITLIDTIELLLENETNQDIKNILVVMQKTLLQGELFVNTLEPYKSKIGELPILFLDMGQKNDDMKSVIKTLVEILQNRLNNIKKFKKVIQYPLIVSIGFIFALGIIFIYLLPQFEPLFSQFGKELPIQTKILLSVKYFLVHYSFLLVSIFFVCILSFIYFYKRFDQIRMSVDRFLVVKFPVAQQVILYFELFIVFKLIQLLLSQKFTLDYAIQKVSSMIRNRYIKLTFMQISNDISKGLLIHESFKKHKIFDALVIKLILVGHNSDQFDLIFGKIANIYQERYDKKVERFIQFIEPVFLFAMALCIVWIMLAIFVPLWDMGKVL